MSIKDQQPKFRAKKHPKLKPKLKRDPRGRRSKLRPDLHMGQLATRIGISPSYLNHIMAGRRVPNLDVAERLARELGVGIEGLNQELEKHRAS